MISEFHIVIKNVKKKIGNAFGICHAVCRVKQRISERKTEKNTMSTSRVEPCAEEQLEETLAPKIKSTASDAHKLMLLSLRDAVSTEAANRDTKSILQYVDTFP